MRWLTRLMAALVLTGALLVSPTPLHAQASGDSGQGAEQDPHVFSWVVAAVSVILVMLIVCMPTRKA